MLPGPGRGIRFGRSYNSLNALEGMPGPLGPGWTHRYAGSLEPLPSGRLRLLQADGVPLFFSDLDGDSVFTATTPLTETSRIEAVPGTSYTRRFRQGGFESYDDLGRLTGSVDADGQTTTLTYSAERLTAVSAGGSRSVQLAYDEEGRVSELSGPAGLIAQYAYHVSGLLARVSYPDGTGYSFTYDGEGQLLTVRDAAGSVLETHAYTGHQAATSEVSGGEERYQFSYSPGATTVTDALGHTTTWEWVEIAGMKYPSRRTGPCSVCGGGGSSEGWTYYPDGRVQTYRDALGRETTYTYNEKGDLETVRDPSGRVTTVAYRYDESGAILEKRQTAPGTGETVWSYQGVDLVRLEQQVSESEEKQVTSFTYGGGRLVAMTGPDGKTKTFSYGSEGDLLAETRPGQDAVTFVYDPMGRPTSVKDAAGSATTISYDVRGRVTRVTGPDGASTTFGYDSAGRLQTATDPLRRTTRYAYDGVGRVVGVIDPMGVTTSTTYDRMSRTVALTDGERHRTRFEHDGYGRVVKTTDPGGRRRASSTTTPGAW